MQLTCLLLGFTFLFLYLINSNKVVKRKTCNSTEKFVGVGNTATGFVYITVKKET